MVHRRLYMVHRRLYTFGVKKHKMQRCKEAQGAKTNCNDVEGYQIHLLHLRSVVYLLYTPRGWQNLGCTNWFVTAGLIRCTMLHKPNSLCELNHDVSLKYYWKILEKGYHFRFFLARKLSNIQGSIDFNLFYTLLYIHLLYTLNINLD